MSRPREYLFVESSSKCRNESRQWTYLEGTLAKKVEVILLLRTVEEERESRVNGSRKNIPGEEEIGW